MHRKNIYRAALLGSAATMLATAFTGVSPALAQDQDESADVEQIVVTGSRIRRPDLDSVSPLQITSSEEIKLSGHTRVEDLMNGLPQIEAAQTTFISNGASGTASLNLRGMGTNRTLVLINGRRIQPGGLIQAPDINQIPARLVERAEVVTGGASATYGADAVAGVVNFVMKDDFEGIEITFGVDGYQHNNDNQYIQDLMDQRGFEYPTGSEGIDGKGFNVSLLMGSDFADGKGHATAYVTWRKDEELLEGARDYSSCALNAAGDWCGGSGNAIVPNFYVSQPLADGSFDWDNWDYWTLDPSGDGFIPSVGNVYNYAPVNHFFRPDTRWSGGVFADYEINEHYRLYMEANFMRDRTVAQIAESGTFFVQNYIIPITSDIIDDTQRQQLIDAFGIDPVNGSFTAYIGKRNVEGGPRQAHLTHNSFRIVTGMDGAIDDNWHYDVSFLYGSTYYTSAYLNDFLATAVEPAILNGSYPVFGYQEITPEAAGGMTGTGIRDGFTETYVLNGYVTGDFDGISPMADSPMSVVLGVEYREEGIRRVSDTIYDQGLLLGQGGPRKGIEGRYNVKEIFTEAVIPLIEGKEYADSLELELAGRFSDYNLSGGNGTYKVGLNWQPTDMVRVLASYNRAVRVANVGELFAEVAGGLWGGEDPCAGAVPEYTQAQCAFTGVTAAQYGNVVASPASQYNGIFGGNLDLSPETADTWSVGAVVNPIDELRFRVDYWDITLKNAIGALAPEYILRQCAETGNGEFCSLVNRGAGGSLWLGQAGAEGAGGITATNQNVPGTAWHVRGVDLAADFVRPLFDGTVTARLIGTMLLEKTNGDTDCKGLINTGCFPAPEWRHTMNLSYESSSIWSITARWRYFSSVDYDGATDTLLLDGGIASQSYFDLKAAFDITESVSLLLGVNNIFDKEPPLVGGSVSTNANSIAGYYDTLGRYLHASMTLTF